MSASTDEDFKLIKELMPLVSAETLQDFLLRYAKDYPEFKAAWRDLLKAKFMPQGATPDDIRASVRSMFNSAPTQTGSGNQWCDDFETAYLHHLCTLVAKHSGFLPRYAQSTHPRNPKFGKFWAFCPIKERDVIYRDIYISRGVLRGGRVESRAVWFVAPRADNIALVALVVRRHAPPSVIACRALRLLSTGDEFPNAWEAPSCRGRRHSRCRRAKELPCDGAMTTWGQSAASGAGTRT